MAARGGMAGGNTTNSNTPRATSGTVELEKWEEIGAKSLVSKPHRHGVGAGGIAASCTGKEGGGVQE